MTTTARALSLQYKISRYSNVFFFSTATQVKRNVWSLKLLFEVKPVS